MNTPNTVKTRIDSILFELPRFGSYAIADPAAERERTRAILAKILEKRATEPVLTAFEEKILAKALNVYECYVDAAIQRKQTGEIIIRPLHTIASIQPEQVETESGQRLWIKSVLKTVYALDMPDEMILKLESVRDCNFRIRMEEGYTDPALPDLLGQAHSENFSLLPEGYLSRDDDGVPRLFSTARSTIPLALEMRNVVRIEFANRNHGGELWRHPHYKANDGCYTSLDQCGFLLRSRRLADKPARVRQYEVKLYDQGTLVFVTTDFVPGKSAHAEPENEHVLSDDALGEIIAQLAAKPAQMPASIQQGLKSVQAWHASGRARDLLQAGKNLAA